MLRHGSLQQLSSTLRHSIRAGTAPSPLPNFFNSALRGFGDVASASAASAASPAASAHPLTHRLRDAARVYKQLSKVRIKQPQKCLSILNCCVQYCLQSACRPEPAMLDTGEHSKTPCHLQARLSALVVSTACAGFVAASGERPDWGKLGWTALGTMGASSAANALNQVSPWETEPGVCLQQHRMLPQNFHQVHQASQVARQQAWHMCLVLQTWPQAYAQALQRELPMQQISAFRSTAPQYPGP